MSTARDWRWRSAVGLVVVNVLDGIIRGDWSFVLWLDAVMAGVFLFALIATRLWPHRLWIRGTR